MTRDPRKILSIKTTPRHVFEAERLRQLAAKAKAKRTQEAAE